MESQYQTKELGVASYLVASGQELVNTQKDNDVVYFIFNNYEACKDMENDYKYKNAFVEAKKFYGAIGDLKRIIFAASREE